MKSASLSLFVLTAVLVACGGSVASETAPGSPCSVCDGPIPSAAQRCPDGSSVGPQCVRLKDGTCGYEVPTCPSGADGGAGDGSAGPLLGLGASCGAPGQAPCAPSFFCKADRSCGGVGACAARPQGCPDLYEPVCGCDGKTYGNACEADGSAMNVASKGECPLPEGATCGTRGVRGACVAGTFCRYEIVAACGATGAPGECTKVPVACGRELDPVCGCDGKTYSNPCEAERAQASVKAAAECP